MGVPGEGFGPLGPPDALGVRVPLGFSASLVARSNETVADTGHVWHRNPDGGACFATSDGGHVYVSNSETAGDGGGASAVGFDQHGRIVSARTILAGTNRNCAGGATPWGTWLSCEENGPIGQVWECDPLGGLDAEVRPALGSFNHEAAAVDAVGRQVFLTEDLPDGRLYRFVPDVWPDLSAGSLYAAAVDETGGVSWRPAPTDRPDRSVETTAFDGGEGIVLIDRSVFVATKGDRRIWELDLDTSTGSVFHDCVASPDTALTRVDNLAVHPATGHLFVAEDGGDLELCLLIERDGVVEVAPVLQFVGHELSEVAGPAFSPDGRFLYVSSQRGTDGAGVTVQVRGDFENFVRRIDGGAVAGTGARRVGNRTSVPLAEP
ncbi:MAG: DUF839 domain-containing protein [Ilumatobacter sp.]|nr:DUF839 domain-containing protein [Ilumatobacter sp.]